MKRFFMLGLTALGLSLAGQQQAPAWFEVSAGIGANATVKGDFSKWSRNNNCCDPWGCQGGGCMPPIITGVQEMGPAPKEQKPAVTPAGYFQQPYTNYQSYDANSHDPYGFQAPSYWYGR